MRPSHRPPTVRAPHRRIAVFAGLAALLLPACSRGVQADESPDWDGETPVLIFAVDGFEWEVILPLVRQGRMPAIADLMRRGVSGKLASMMPSRSPRLWTTIATGRRPLEHGILGFTLPDSDPEAPSFYTSRDRKVKAFWNILGDHGVSSTTIGWWTTYPAEEVDGVMVSQTNVHLGGVQKGRLMADSPRQVWPPEEESLVLGLLEEQEQRLDSLTQEIFGDFPRKLRLHERARWNQCLWSFRGDSTYVAALEALLDRGVRSRVTTLYFGGTDVVGHRFWAAYRPQAFDLPEDCEDPEIFGHVIPAYYEYIDQVIARVLERYPPETTVLIVSDHGMGERPSEDLREYPGFLSDHTGSHHHSLISGAFVAAGRGIRKGDIPTPVEEITPADMQDLGSIMDFCPTLLALVGVPYGETMAGSPMETVLDPDFLEAHPLASVSTYDDPAWLAARGEAIVDDSSERLQQLKNLGYQGEDEDED